MISCIDIVVIAEAYQKVAPVQVRDAIACIDIVVIAEAYQKVAPVQVRDAVDRGGG